MWRVVSVILASARVEYVAVTSETSVSPKNASFFNAAW